MTTTPDATAPPTIREVRPDDVPTLVRFVHELAAYEREPDACTLTEAALAAALFADRARVFGHVVEVDGETAGMALWFVTFSTWTGVHGIHLEDLWVDPAHRRRGLALALLRRLAAVCRERGYARLEWSVLDWNTPALDFYASISSEPMDGWTTHRVHGPALAALAGEGQSSRTNQ